MYRECVARVEGQSLAQRRPRGVVLTPGGDHRPDLVDEPAGPVSP
ncbi:hypothetical protein WJ438_01950 [Streptomyces sp. GD-15H]